MTDTVRMAIERADVEALRALVGADPALAEADVTWGDGGKNVVPPLHFVCDAVFRGLASDEQALELAEVLLAAGVDADRAYAKSGDTYLIAAASLGAESVGLRLVERGADVTRRGLFGATALHWAALMGLDRLAVRLVEAGSDIELRDVRYDCTPLMWTLHAWSDAKDERREGLVRTARTLVARGARVPPGAFARLAADRDAPLRAALGTAPSG